MPRVIVPHRANLFFTQRRLIVYSGFLVQLAVGILVGLSFNQPGHPALTLAPIPGQVGLCRVAQVQPFTEAWLLGTQAGDAVRVSSTGASAQVCLAPNVVVQMRTTLLEPTLTANVVPPPLEDPQVALEGILALLLNLLGSAILLRAAHRPVARVAYSLFACTSLLFCLLSIQWTNILWGSLLLFILGTLVPGLAATFVCLFPARTSPEQSGQGAKQHWRLFRYSPLLVAGGLVVVGVPLLWWWPQARLAVFLMTAASSLGCLGVVGWMLCWGIHRLPRQEKPRTRLVVLGTLGLLLPLLILSLRLLGSERLMEPGVVDLLPLPMAALPLTAGYAVFRHQLEGGVMRLVSRRLMRVVLWLLLASAFVLVGVVGQLALTKSFPLTRATALFLPAWVLLSLWLFPLAWTNVRDLGDQVLYRDFYQYNRSLRELSTALTRLQGLKEISAFVLPRLAHLLNATEIALIVRPSPQTSLGGEVEEHSVCTAPWQIYCHPAGSLSLTRERLIRIANLALTQRAQASDGPLLLDGLLLLALYAGEQLSGFLCLGPKDNLESYSRQDTSFLATLAAQLSVLEVNSRYLAQAQADAQQLAALTHRVVSAQEEERRHLALDLHDEALQQAMLTVRQLSDASTMTDVAEVMPLARSVVESLRQTCLELRPPLLDELGLEEALPWLAQQTEQRSKASGASLCIQVRSDDTDQPRLPADVELALYRVAQEALSNALKHAGASMVVVRLRRCGSGKVVLLIADNGRGFRRHQPGNGRLGLVGMQERLLAIDGRFQIRTCPGRGVVVRAVYLKPPAGAVEAMAQDPRQGVFL
ncbi:MAG TPA: sensor histidine kinase [Ktedonobacterales bacterium]|nr:sensor histidine kinase [Ktedonobacterales bacterium]